MIDLRDLRENPDTYRRGAERKNVAVDIDAILALDGERRAAQLEFERLRAEQNRASGEIARIADPAARKAAIARVAELKTAVKEAEARARDREAALQPLLLAIPQPPDEDVPIGRDAADNVVVRVEGAPRVFGSGRSRTSSWPRGTGWSTSSAACGSQGVARTSSSAPARSYTRPSWPWPWT